MLRNLELAQYNFLGLLRWIFLNFSEKSTFYVYDKFPITIDIIPIKMYYNHKLLQMQNFLIPTIRNVKMYKDNKIEFRYYIPFI